MSKTRTRIKICGITNFVDAQAAVDIGADALGFILVPDTPRFVAEGAWSSILAGVPPFVSSVGVVALCDAGGFNPAWRALTALQFYEGGCTAAEAGTTRLIRAVRVKDAASLDEIERYLTAASPHALLLDTYHKDRLGGSGETFNWDLALEAKVRFRLPIILAGGLTPDNVGEAVARVRPYAVDVSSGVEAEPGRKDHAKLKEFFQAVREADER